MVMAGDRGDSVPCPMELYLNVPETLALPLRSSCDLIGCDRKASMLTLYEKLRRQEKAEQG